MLERFAFGIDADEGFDNRADYHQSGTDEKDQTEGDLRDDEHVAPEPQRAAARRTGRTGLQHAVQVRAGRLEDGQYADEHSIMLVQPCVR